MTAFVRNGNRAPDELRPVRITRAYTVHAEGSVLIEFGATKVLCTASVEDKVPPHRRGSGQGWVTAEYGMLPRATHTRSDREAACFGWPSQMSVTPGKGPRRGRGGPQGTHRQRSCPRTGLSRLRHSRAT